ncbi:hypothetical protein [Kitasatospora sp. GP82]|uniref:hypothetical protein n=1 Tax=Kitasatospora sp. GP82 TaxID=3035089 RepID=UPI0024739E63|nr:hypothetical protein [Kitasatospora sp. GP82]MDH6124051.1 hypothetical protein [Kitasatospora sp. GP82]
MSIEAIGNSTTETLGRLFTELAQDDRFTAGLRDSGISLLMEHSRPDLRIFVSAEGAVVGDGAPEYATLTIKSTAATAHELWLGRTSFPAAITSGRLRIFGKVAKVLELMPILAPAFERYPAIVTAVGA